MPADNKKNGVISPGRSDAFWRRVYLAVVGVTFVVITGLWAFSRFFS
ncbi:MAG: hypothetical protein IPM25_00640 [Chloracidobacterium sp.]|nr:hypothetical protein [Chloracidobacterium sp.]